jgi:hypothetical protein
MAVPVLYYMARRHERQAEAQAAVPAEVVS